MNLIKNMSRPYFNPKSNGKKDLVTVYIYIYIHKISENIDEKI